MILHTTNKINGCKTRIKWGRKDEKASGNMELESKEISRMKG